MNTSLSLKRRSKTVSVLLQIFLTIIACTILMPFVWMISASLNSNTEVLRMPFQWIPKQIKWDNYVVIFQRAPMSIFISNSLKIAILSVAGLLLFGSMAAYAFAKLQFKGRDKVFLLFIATMMIPSSVVMIPKYVLFQNIGLLGSHYSLILPAIFNPTMIFLMRQHFMGIPNELIEAAKIDGASHIYIYSKIIMPMSKSVLSTVFLLSFIGSWNDFMNPLLYLSSLKSYTIPIGITTFNSSHTSMRAWTSAASLVAIIPVFTIFLFGQRYLLDGIATTGIKG